MRAMAALIKRELLEHRGAFVYAPAAMLIALAVAVFYGVLTAGSNAVPFPLPGATMPFQLALAGIFGAWTVYAIIGLFFYYADSFSADRRNNAILFWKSMPQSDLTILTSKSLAGITIFPALIAGFAFVSGVVVFAAFLLAAARIRSFQAPSFPDGLVSLIEIGFVGTVYLVLSILWMAPFLAWVAGLSTLVRRWSIPLAVLIPSGVVLLEFVNAAGGLRGSRPIADFLSWRLQGLVDPPEVFAALAQPDGPSALLGTIVANVDWPHLALGLVFTAVVVYLASEYRRRRLDA